MDWLKRLKTGDRVIVRCLACTDDIELVTDVTNSCVRVGSMTFCNETGKITIPHGASHMLFLPYLVEATDEAVDGICRHRAALVVSKLDMAELVRVPLDVLDGFIEAVRVANS